MTEDGMNRGMYTGDDWNGHTFHWHDGPVGTANSHTHLEIGYWTYGNNETPATLPQISYQCNNHDFMGSTVHIVGSANGIFYNRAELTTTNISTANIETLYVTSKLGGSGGMNEASCVPEANITVANVATLYVTEKLAPNVRTRSKHFCSKALLLFMQLLQLQMFYIKYFKCCNSKCSNCICFFSCV